MRGPTRTKSIATACCLAAAVLGWSPEADAGAPKWTAASRARIHPGVQTRTRTSQCTSNFVFYDSKHVYIGQAAHCSSLGGLTAVNGCTTPVLPNGTKVTIEGASRPGVVVYNSWATMRRLGERSGNACLGNDFALVRVDRADRRRVNPSVPTWGGPTGFDRSARFGDLVYTYGDSSLRVGIDRLSPHVGMSTFEGYGGWNHGMYTLTPGIFGDSGSAVIGPSGGALGILSTLSTVPPGQNNASDLYKAMVYMKKHTGLDGVKLAKGTVPFAGL